jgi:NTE family protein
MNILSRALGRPKNPPPSGKKRINLALQGGGAHGAFTWGVLDRLLEDETLDLAWMSATSAGAVNAVAVAAGLAESGRAGARAKLRAVWEAVAKAGLPDLDITQEG